MTSNDTRIKICGLRSAEAAVVASDAGANYMGFVFVEGVRRQLQPEEGAQILADYREGRKTLNRPVLVGLFRNQDARMVNETARNAGLDFLQLCGDEDSEYVEQLELPVFKQVRVKDDTTPVQLDSIVSNHLDAGCGVVLDKYDKDTPGGSGKSFDWAVADRVAHKENILLAGGLTPENVGSAISQLSPWGVDVSSGVETDGVKDPARIRAFIEAVRQA